MHRNSELAVHRSRYVDWFRMQRGGRVCHLEAFYRNFHILGLSVVIENLQRIPNLYQHLRGGWDLRVTKASKSVWPCISRSKGWRWILNKPVLHWLHIDTCVTLEKDMSQQLWGLLENIPQVLLLYAECRSTQHWWQMTAALLKKKIFKIWVHQ